jgi:hypothetical protein
LRRSELAQNAPEGRDEYSLNNLKAWSTTAAANLQELFSHIAGETGNSLESIENRFKQLRRTSDSSRSLQAPADWSARYLASTQEEGFYIPGDRGTLYALYNLFNREQQEVDFAENSGAPNTRAVHLEDPVPPLSVLSATTEANRVSAVPSQTVQINLPTPPDSQLYSRIYAQLPPDPTDLSTLTAPGSSYTYQPLNKPISERRGEIAAWRTLRNVWRENGVRSINPNDADKLYDFQRRRLHSQMLKVLEATGNAAGRPASSEEARKLRDCLKEYELRRQEMLAIMRDREDEGYPVGGEVDPLNIGAQGDEMYTGILNQTGYLDDPMGELSSGKGLTLAEGELEQSYQLPDYPLPENLDMAEPIFIRIRPGVGEGLRANISASGLPLVVCDPQTPPPAGAVVLNWGDYAWEPPEDVAVINAPSDVGEARNKKIALPKLGNLAPKSTARPDIAFSQFGQAFVTKASLGQGGRGNQLRQNITGEAVTYQNGELRPFGNIPASSLEADTIYQEYLPNRKEYRALMLGGQVVALYEKKTQTREGETGEMRPNNFEYEALNTITTRQLKASRGAMARLNLDFGGVDLVLDEDTDRMLVFEVNTAPGMGQESLKKLYGALINQLSREEV